MLESAETYRTDHLCAVILRIDANLFCRKTSKIRLLAFFVKMTLHYIHLETTPDVAVCNWPIVSIDGLPRLNIFQILSDTNKINIILISQLIYFQILNCLKIYIE